MEAGLLMPAWNPRSFLNQFPGQDFTVDQTGLELTASGLGHIASTLVLSGADLVLLGGVETWPGFHLSRL